MKKKALALVMSALILVPTALVGCGSKKETADIVIIGAGGAGLSAAVQAKQEGVENVILLEKMPMVGGNTNRATGGLNAAETEQQKDKNIEDSIETMYNDTMKGGYNKNNPDLVEKLTSKYPGIDVNYISETLNAAVVFIQPLSADKCNGEEY